MKPTTTMAIAMAEHLRKQEGRTEVAAPICTWCEDVIEGQPNATIHRVCELLQGLQQNTPLVALTAVEIPGPSRAYDALKRRVPNPLVRFIRRPSEVK